MKFIIAKHYFCALCLNIIDEKIGIDSTDEVYGNVCQLQQWDLRKKADMVIVAFGSAPAVPNWYVS